jgi:DNA-directed RNA polymerase specialized sigma24 family protein
MNDEQTRTRFETLPLTLMKDAYNLTRWLMKNQEDAEDMVQESYMRAYPKRPCESCPARGMGSRS